MGFAKGFNQVEAAAEKAVRQIVEEHGYSLWDVVFVKEGAAWYLRILIDKPEGISIDDCESIDGLINAEIDKQPFIDKIDYLEVGSAGLERPIRRVDQLHASVGKRIRLKTYKLCEGLTEKDVRCVLKSFDGERVVVSGEFGEICEVGLLLSEISAMNYDDFDDFDEIITEV
ncbi:MAG: ribosome maturation factor RimP [Oscillospiraceae bacterium]|nr:ribosome maturation factor RimP [Oscillospiraceae bacterium]